MLRSQHSQTLPPPVPRVTPGPVPRCKLRSFFWEPLPPSRVALTFWEDHPPAVQLLLENVDLVETMFQVSAFSNEQLNALYTPLPIPPLPPVPLSHVFSGYYGL